MIHDSWRPVLQIMMMVLLLLLLLLLSIYMPETNESILVIACPTD
jgi:hypothetical protein